MFDAIANWFNALFEEGRSLTAFIWAQIVGFLVSVWSIVLTIATLVWLFLREVLTAIQASVAAIDAVTVPATPSGSPGTIGYFLNVANTFFPLSELFVFLVAYGALMAGLTVYRVVKSWIPTVSG